MKANPHDVTDPAVNAAALSAAASLFRGLGDPNRLAILRHLAST
jgi:DNA-binding transcriptional ArsR family regulator